MPRWALVFGEDRVEELSAPELHLGRDSECEIPFEEEQTSVSRSHAVLVPGPDGVLVRDLGSTNGTRINGSSVIAPTTARHGDLIEFGHVRATLEDLEYQGPVRAATQFFGGDAQEAPEPPLPPAARLSMGTPWPQDPEPGVGTGPGPGAADPHPTRVRKPAAVPLGERRFPAGLGRDAGSEDPALPAARVPRPPVLPSVPGSAGSSPTSGPGILPPAAAGTEPDSAPPATAPGTLATIGMTISIVAACLTVVALMPCLGWLNWLNLLLGGSANILCWASVFTEGRSIPSRNRAIIGLVVSFAFLFVGSIRLLMGGGCL